MRNTEAAFKWIVGILKDLNVPFEIDGGMAAEAYGSERELADIDINVPNEDFYKIIPRLEKYITFGPGWYRDQNWDLLMVSLKYSGQNIDIAALGQIKYFNKKEDKWKDLPSDLSSTRIMRFMGMDLPFINEIKLMIYKEELGRGVDRKDVHSMIKHLNQSE